MEKYILTLFKRGEEKRHLFLSECSSTSEQFVETIRKTTIAIFASENFERKNKLKQNSQSPKIQEICLESYSIFLQQMAEI